MKKRIIFFLLLLFGTALFAAVYFVRYKNLSETTFISPDELVLTRYADNLSKGAITFEEYTEDYRPRLTFLNNEGQVLPGKFFGYSFVMSVFTPLVGLKYLQFFVFVCIVLAIFSLGRELARKYGNQSSYRGSIIALFSLSVAGLSYVLFKGFLENPLVIFVAIIFFIQVMNHRALLASLLGSFVLYLRPDMIFFIIPGLLIVCSILIIQKKRNKLLRMISIGVLFLSWILLQNYQITGYYTKFGPTLMRMGADKGIAVISNTYSQNIVQGIKHFMMVGAYALPGVFLYALFLVKRLIKTKQIWITDYVLASFLVHMIYIFVSGGMMGANYDGSFYRYLAIYVIILSVSALIELLHKSFQGSKLLVIISLGLVLTVFGQMEIINKYNKIHSLYHRIYAEFTEYVDSDDQVLVITDSLDKVFGRDGVGIKIINGNRALALDTFGKYCDSRSKFDGVYIALDNFRKVYGQQYFINNEIPATRLGDDPSIYLYKCK